MRCGRPAPASSTPSRPRPTPCAPPRPEATPSPGSHFPVGKPFLRTARIVCPTEEKAQPCPWGLRAWGQVTNSSDHEFPRPGGGDGYCLATAQDGHRVKLDPGYGSPQSTVKCSVPRRSVPLVLLGSPGPAALHRASRALAFCGEGCQGPRGQLATVPGARQLAGAGVCARWEEGGTRQMARGQAGGTAPCGQSTQTSACRLLRSVPGDTVAGLWSQPSRPSSRGPSSGTAPPLHRRQAWVLWFP